MKDKERKRCKENYNEYSVRLNKLLAKTDFKKTRNIFVVERHYVEKLIKLNYIQHTTFINITIRFLRYAKSYIENMQLIILKNGQRTHFLLFHI